MPRSFGRSFPAANQLGIASGVVLNESRITFSGQRGVVLVWFGAQFTSPNVVEKNMVRLADVRSAPLFGFNSGSANMLGAVGARVGCVLMAMLIDPPVGSFIEVAANLSNDVVDLTAADGFVSGVTFGFDDAEGPTVTLS